MSQSAEVNSRLPSGYVEHPAAGRIPMVECFWSSTPHMGPLASEHRVLPDGCVDVIARCSAAHVELFAVGAMTAPLVTTGADDEAWFGVRFRPGWGQAALDVPMQSLVDQRVNLSLLSRAAVRWQELLGDAPQGAARFALFRALAGELTETRRRCSATVEVATRTLTQQPSTPIAVLAGRLGVTRQYLARLFAAEVGLSPKMFARVARLRRTLQRARESVTVDWADLAVGHGFSDQAHLAGEFRELVGLTPTRWFASERVKVPILQEEPAAVQ